MSHAPTFLRLPIPFLLLLGLASGASAQVVELGGNTVASASAAVPTCSDNDGGGGATEATASCAAMGYAAAASAESSRTSSTQGGAVFARAEAEASSVGGGATLSASATGDGAANSSWTLTTDHHYSAYIDVSGGATASFNDGMVNLPPSGVLVPDTYALQANATAVALAEDDDGAVTVTAGPREATAEVTFAEVGAADLIRGTLTAGGSPVAGLEVTARVGSTIVATAFTASDGSYLLPGLPGTVTIEVVDPDGGFLTLGSGSLAPPLVFDGDLVAATVPVGGWPFALLLGAALGAVGLVALKATRPARAARGSGGDAPLGSGSGSWWRTG